MKLIVHALLVACLASLSFVAQADTVYVTKLRTAKVALFDRAEGEKTGEIPREEFVPRSWKLKGEPQRGFVEVVDARGATFWVKNFVIETDRRVSSTAECGVKLAGSERKMGATRGLGEDCQ